MEEGGDVADDVWDDVWFHIVNFVCVATKYALKDMSNELPVNVDGGILFFCDVVLFCRKLVIVIVGRWCLYSDVWLYR